MVGPPVLPLLHALNDRVQQGHSGKPASGGNCFGEELNGPGNCSEGVCPGGGVAQSYVAALHRGPGLAVGGMPAVSLATACRFPRPAIFADGFESGDTSRWQ
ncbi:MAG: hypothetical protein GY719_26880 [bacterium]|nr:hypothetical protein [bacterium]